MSDLAIMVPRYSCILSAGWGDITPPYVYPHRAIYIDVSLSQGGVVNPVINLTSSQIVAISRTVQLGQDGRQAISPCDGNTRG